MCFWGKFYVPRLLECPVAAIATTEHLILADNLEKYKSHHHIAAVEGLKTQRGTHSTRNVFNKYTWRRKRKYATRPFSVWKCRGHQMLRVHRGRPDLKIVPPQNTQIIDLIAQTLIKFFSSLNSSYSFQHNPASNWTGDLSFRTMK